MALNRRDFLRMSAALTAAGMSPSLFAATKNNLPLWRTRDAKCDHCSGGSTR